MADKAYNIYSLTLYRKTLLTPGAATPIKKQRFIECEKGKTTEENHLKYKETVYK